MENKNKAQLVKWFNQMQEIEKSAKDMYFKIADTPDLKEEVKKIFRDVAQEEEKHILIVQKIINIINVGI